MYCIPTKRIILIKDDSKPACNTIMLQDKLKKMTAFINAIWCPSAAGSIDKGCRFLSKPENILN
jgi:hypothetical protein